MRTKLIGKLSKGYKQRVGLSSALIHNPDVLILDEPTAGLDPKQIIETRELIRALAGSHTVVLSTHILPEVSMTCGRVVIINKGRVVAEDTPENLTRRLQGAGTIRLEVRGDQAEALAAVRAVLAFTRAPRTGDAVSTSGRGRPDVRTELALVVRARPRSLAGRHEPEDIFLTSPPRTPKAARRLRTKA